MKAIVDRLKPVRASWRLLLAALARLKARVQDKLDPRPTDRAAK